MKKEKEVLQNTLSAGGYVAPGIRIYAVKRRIVLCGSAGGSGETELSEEGDTSDWF